MSWTSQKMKSLSSTGSFITGVEQRVVGLGVVRADLAPARGIKLFAQARWLRGILLFFHPPQERLACNFTGVGVTFGELLLDELLNRLCHCDFHASKLPQNSSPNNAQICHDNPNVKLATFTLEPGTVAVEPAQRLP